MPIGDSTDELDLMLADVGVPVKYGGAAAVNGSFRRKGELVDQGGIMVALETDQVRIRASAISGLEVERTIVVNGTDCRIVDIGKADIEGLQAIAIVRVGT